MCRGRIWRFNKNWYDRDREESLLQSGKHIRLLTGLVLLTLCFIWGNSLMPGEVSGAFSDWVGSLLQHILGRAVETDAGHGVLRKLAHGTEYMALGAELAVLLGLRLKKEWSLIALGGVSTALLDETIQLFVSGRSGQIRDVWIDLGGFTVGVLLVLAAVMLKKTGK